MCVCVCVCVRACARHVCVQGERALVPVCGQAGCPWLCVSLAMHRGVSHGWGRGRWVSPRCAKVHRVRVPVCTQVCAGAPHPGRSRGGGPGDHIWPCPQAWVPAPTRVHHDPYALSSRPSPWRECRRCRCPLIIEGPRLIMGPWTSSLNISSGRDMAGTARPPARPSSTGDAAWHLPDPRGQGEAAPCTTRESHGTSWGPCSRAVHVCACAAACKPGCARARGVGFRLRTPLHGACTCVCHGGCPGRRPRRGAPTHVSGVTCMVLPPFGDTRTGGTPTPALLQRQEPKDGVGGETSWGIWDPPGLPALTARFFPSIPGFSSSFSSNATKTA